MKRNFLVGYDISDPRRLRKTARVLSQYGSRVQYSFFHCFLSGRQKGEMVDLLKQVIVEDEDQVLILPVTERQLAEMEFIGFKIDLVAEGIVVV